MQPAQSIVIAMLAIYTVKQLGKRVHVLENNEGLLERDFATYHSFYESFGMTCAKRADATSQICYCLKASNNAFFNEQILRGKLDLSDIVLIVDEVRPRARSRRDLAATRASLTLVPRRPPTF